MTMRIDNDDNDDDDPIERWPAQILLYGTQNVYKSTPLASLSMGSECEQSKLFYVLAQLLSASLREFFAVALFIVLTLRADGYDFFNSGIILFLILIVVRLPFLNSYAFIFEATTIKSWEIKHVGVQKHSNWGYNTLHAIAILVTHILAGMATAAFKVYYEVTYGKEDMGAQPLITPELVVDTRVLKNLGTDWAANERLNRLKPASEWTDGIKHIMLPLNSTDTTHGIDKTALQLWYFCEDAAYVTLLCICFVHIWIGTGVVKEKYDSSANVPLNPFRPRYWQQLFKISLLLTMIQLALSRAFPTAHGSLHATVYKLQYQAWMPNAHLVDTENGEAVTRIFGGLIGVVLGKIYSWTLLSTKLDKDDTWYFSLVWGMESPFEAEKELKKKQYAAISANDEEDPSYGYGGSDALTSLTARPSDFKLRLPYTLNHSK